MRLVINKCKNEIKFAGKTQFAITMLLGYQHEVAKFVSPRSMHGLRGVGQYTNGLR